MVRFDIITIFPEVFNAYFNTSIIKRAQARGLIRIEVHNLRDYAINKHKSLDDKPYGGGAGMVMMAEPIIKAVEIIKKKSKYKKSVVVLFSAKGNQFNQKMAIQFSKVNHIIMICGRYEGIDERVKIILKAKEISIGPYVLTDGEVPAMAVVSAVARLIPGAIAFASLQEESHWNLLLKNEGWVKKGLEYPHYTRPETILYKGKKYSVPKILISGHHKNIAAWRKDKSE